MDTPRTDLEMTGCLARAVGMRLPDDRLPVVSQALAQLRALAATLDELPLEAVDPTSARPRWQ